MGSPTFTLREGRVASSQGQEPDDNMDREPMPAPLLVPPSLPHDFRLAVRAGRHAGPTNRCCPGFLQCNLVVLEEPLAYDFLLFCQRNPRACPLIEVGDAGCPSADAVAAEADLRTDVPKYRVYRHGKLVAEVTDARPYWPENAVAFLIGCSFTCDRALAEGGIPLRSAEQRTNVPMYKTNIPCRPAGAFRGNVVVSMRPVRATDVATASAITGRYPHAHGAPLCVGCPAAIGVRDLEVPDWGDAVRLLPEEVPMFHACGVTPMAAIVESQVAFALTHSPGHMFVTDVPADRPWP